MCPPLSEFSGDVVPACKIPAMNTLRGIELRYVLTMHLARYGRSTIRELVDALAFHGFAADSPANKSVSDACGGSAVEGGFAASVAGSTDPAGCRAAPSIGFVNVSWRCGPRQFAQRRAHRHVPPSCDG